MVFCTILCMFDCTKNKFRCILEYLGDIPLIGGLVESLYPTLQLLSFVME